MAKFGIGQSVRRVEDPRLLTGGGRYTDDTKLWEWYRLVMVGSPERVIRRNISIVQLDMANQEVMRWNLFAAFPVKYTAPGFNAKGNDLSIETLEIAYERIDRA